MQWSPILKTVYQRYPASIRSSDWPGIVAAANAGDKEKALALGAAHEGRRKGIRAENVLARRLRLQRLALFALQRQARIDLVAIFGEVRSPFLDWIEKKGGDSIHLSFLNKKAHEAVVLLRRRLTKWATDNIFSAITIGFKATANALDPIFKENQESFNMEIAESSDLMEDRLTFGLSSRNRKGLKGPDLETLKWQDKSDAIYARLVKTNLVGLRPSDRIFDLTQQAERQMKRILTGEISKGTSARELAKKMERFLSPEVLNQTEPLGPGVYRSPFKNALRLARTEISDAYINASVEFAKDRPWIEGVRATLSPAHDKEDECDDTAGDLFTPDEFAAEYPKHPHCMCFPVYVIKDEYLAGSKEDAA